MNFKHKNKALATFLASALGGIGVHRFYLYGVKDIPGWIHLATLPLSLIVIQFNPGRPLLFPAGLFVLSVLTAFVEALIIGVTPDEKWDARHNPGSGRQSHSGWPLVLALVAAVAGGAIAVLTVLARALDLWLTGGGQG